jgi:hypothetical protein
MVVWPKDYQPFHAEIDTFTRIAAQQSAAHVPIPADA